MNQDDTVGEASATLDGDRNRRCEAKLIAFAMMMVTKFGAIQFPQLLRQVGRNDFADRNPRPRIARPRDHPQRLPGCNHDELNLPIAAQIVDHSRELWRFAQDICRLLYYFRQYYGALIYLLFELTRDRFSKNDRRGNQTDE